MPESPDTGAPAWRTLHGVAVLLVLALFLWSLQSILNPFLLWVLLVFVLWPYAGSRSHLLLVTATGVLTLIWLLDSTGFLLAPFLLALGLAYVLHPLVERMERVPLPRGRRLPRSVAVALLALPATVGLVLLIVFGAPELGRQTARLIDQVPGLISGAVAWMERAQRELATRDLAYVDEAALQARLRAVQPDAVVAWLQERQAEIAGRAWRGVLGVGRGIGSVLTILGYVFLTPILTFYVLRDWDRITERLADLVPGPQRDRVVGFAGRYDELLAGYLRGQLTAAGLVGVLTWLAFLVLGFPSALLLGVIAGVFNTVPYMGLVASLIPAVLLALFATPDPMIGLLKVAGVFAFVQVMDSAVIGPKVVGEAVGLHPVWVILALAVSGYFFGFVGLLIAVPLAVLVKLLIEVAVLRYRESSVYRGERPLVRTD